MNNDILQEEQSFTALAVNRFFQNIAPDEAPLVAECVARLFRAFEDGHSFIYVSDEQRAQLLQAKTLVAETGTPLILRDKRLFLAKFYDLERKLAQEIGRLSRDTIAENDQEMAVLLQKWFDKSGSEDQQAAAALALISPFILISGGPGTGKTTTVAKLLALLCQNKLPEIKLAAPTGKAAARMTEALHNAVAKMSDLSPEIRAHLNQLNAQTVHRLLGLSPPQMQPRHSDKQPISADILLLDEASMLDSYLFYQVLNATPSHCRVILLGDTNQLPSVGMGAVLEALSQNQPLTSEQQQRIQTLLPHRTQPENLAQQHAHLRISHRFDDQSAIGQLARAVLRQDGQGAWALLQEKTPDLGSLNATYQTVAKQLWQAHQPYWQAVAAQDFQAAFALMNDFVVLTATRMDMQHINQSYINLCQANATAAHPDFFHGQMIMVQQNDIQQELYNGDIGMIVQHNQQMSAAFMQHNELRFIPINRLPAYESAFAMTVHKSQGSEYRHVWLYASDESQNTLNQALLYTAITRAKAQFTFYGSAQTFQAACLQNESRRSHLRQFLNEMGKK